MRISLVAIFKEFYLFYQVKQVEQCLYAVEAKCTSDQVLSNSYQLIENMRDMTSHTVNYRGAATRQLFTYEADQNPEGELFPVP